MTFFFFLNPKFGDPGGLATKAFGEEIKKRKHSLDVQEKQKEFLTAQAAREKLESEAADNRQILAAKRAELVAAAELLHAEEEEFAIMLLLLH